MIFKMDIFGQKLKFVRVKICLYFSPSNLEKNMYVRTVRMHVRTVHTHAKNVRMHVRTHGVHMQSTHVCAYAVIRRKFQVKFLLKFQLKLCENYNKIS